MVRLAATVMLVRRAEHAPFEVFMLRRSEASHFVPDVYVFPGGTVDAADLSQQAFDRTRGIDLRALRREFRAKRTPALPVPVDEPTTRECAGLLIAGVRELFEEAGVLLACNAAGNALSVGDLAPLEPLLHAARRRVHSGEQRFDELLEEAGVYADASALSLFSQWITPPVYPRRYNAHFFVAFASADQAASADLIETHDGIWIAPQTALKRLADGDLRMVYPTIKHVERLARFGSPSELLEFTRTKPIVSVMPQTPGEHQFVLPAELEYAW